MSLQSLQNLAENAQEFARTYVSLTEALMSQGVPEDRARDEARKSATFAAMFPDEEVHPPEEPWE